MNTNPIRRCAECPRLTRPSRTLIAEYPGTSQRYGGLCMTCHRQTVKRTGTDPEPRPSNEYTLAGLASFIRRRNERLSA